MLYRATCALALGIFCGACAARSHPDVTAQPPHPAAAEFPSLEVPKVDSATLASLSAQLQRLAQDSSILGLSPADPRFYALFRDLEAAQERFAIALTTPDATGQTLYDRLRAMTARTDSLFRKLEERNRQAPRP